MEQGLIGSSINKTMLVVTLHIIGHYKKRCVHFRVTYCVRSNRIMYRTIEVRSNGKVYSLIILFSKLNIYKWIFNLGGNRSSHIPIHLDLTNQMSTIIVEYYSRSLFFYFLRKTGKMQLSASSLQTSWKCCSF